MRHLQRMQAIGALGRGVQIEQFLDRAVDGDVASIRWLSAGRAGDRYTLRLHHVLDVGTSDSWEISEFPPLDPDEYLGEGRVVLETASAEDLVDGAGSRFAAREDRWVNQSLAAADYMDVLGESS